MKSLLTIALIAVASAVAAQSNNQGTEPPAKLEEFRKTFEKASESLAAPSRQTLITSLDTLINARIQSGDYEGAIRARDRREQVLSLASQNTASSDELVIKLADGSRSGSGLKYDSKEDKISGFTKTSQSVRWELGKTVPGTYSALVTYSCAKGPKDEDDKLTPKTGGVFTLQEVTSLASTPTEKLSYTVQSTGGWDQPITRNIGKIDITGSRLTLDLSVVNANAGGLMHLYSIRLIPNENSPTSDNFSSPSMPDELAEIQAQFFASISGQATPIISTYTNSLRQQLDQLAQDQNLELASEVQQELLIAENLATDPTLIYRTPAASSSPSITQASSDPEIEQPESTYRSELTQIRKDLGTKWLAALATLKDELTREQKFAEALLVRDEEERVTTLLATDPLSSGLANKLEPISLLPRSARLEVEPKPELERNALTFSKDGSTASWDLNPDSPAGTYELILNFHPGELTTGTCSFKIGDDQLLTANLSGTKGKRKQSILIGECALDALTTSLTLTTSQLDGNDPDLHLLSIDLAPQGTWASSQLEPATDDDLSNLPPGGGFEKLNGARWADQDNRKQGEFVFSHNGKDHTFRLYFVEIPPRTKPEGKFATAALKRAAALLKTREDEIISFGKKVDTEIRNSLKDKSVTIYTNWETRGRAGGAYAYILVDGKPLSLTLVENGQARTSGPIPSIAPFISQERGSGRSFQAQLQAAEKIAQKGKIGLWGL